MKKKAHLKPAPRTYFATHPWQCRHFSDYSEITAYVEASGAWERIVTIHPTAGASAEELATLITHLVNNHQQNRHLLRDALDALEAVMKEGLNYSTEQVADRVVVNIRQVVRSRKKRPINSQTKCNAIYGRCHGNTV